jgi:hypothetical protein
MVLIQMVGVNRSHRGGCSRVAQVSFGVAPGHQVFIEFAPASEIKRCQVAQVSGDRIKPGHRVHPGASLNQVIRVVEVVRALELNECRSASDHRSVGSSS